MKIYIKFTILERPTYRSPLKLTLVWISPFQTSAITTAIYDIKFLADIRI